MNLKTNNLALKRAVGFYLNFFFIYSDGVTTFFTFLIATGIESVAIADFFGNNKELMFGKTPP
jgi:hypothetical protein